MENNKVVVEIDNVKCDIDYVNGVEFDGEVTEEEVRSYIERAAEKKTLSLDDPQRIPREAKLIGLELKVDGPDVDITYKWDLQPFERIRRITGYLVGTLDRFNNGKRAEVEDRVTHSITDDCEDVYVDETPKSKDKGMEMGE